MPHISVEALVDLQVSTVGREEREADRRGVINKLQRRLLWKLRCLND
jgi:hypothetical protein